MRGRDLLLLAVLALGCGKSVPKPVEIVLNEDECASCRMAISRRAFAAEAVTPAGTAHLFDDIGCLVRWMAGNPLPDGTGLFVVDFASGKWLDAPRARYVHAASLETPMGSGLAAFGSEEAAAAEAQRLRGKVLDWGGLRGGDSR